MWKFIQKLWKKTILWSWLLNLSNNNKGIQTELVDGLNKISTTVRSNSWGMTAQPMGVTPHRAPCYLCIYLWLSICMNWWQQVTGLWLLLCFGLSVPQTVVWLYFNIAVKAAHTFIQEVIFISEALFSFQSKTSCLCLFFNFYCNEQVVEGP